MTTIVKRKFRVSRRIGKSLHGLQKDAVNKRNYRPGQHGKMPPKKISDFSKQNTAQIVLRSYYVIGKKPFSRIFYKAYKTKGNTTDNLVSLLEKRLSSVLFHSRLVPTIYSARQLISHKHVLVNDKVINISSYCLKEGDKVQIRDRTKTKNIPFIGESAPSNGEAPHYLQVNHDDKSVKLLTSPKFADVPYPIVMEPNLVIEYFSSKV
jgi:small subunit ribosomal protein S4